MNDHEVFRENSYGVIPLRKEGEEWFVLLIQHGSSGYWGFPKGHAEAGETPQETAKRELLEETNLEVVRFLSESYLEEHYHFRIRGKSIDKTVWFYVAEVQGQVCLQQEEVSGSQWVSLANASQVITYETDRSMCRSAAKLVREQ